MKLTANHIPYRPEIDGLRAIAVLSVVIFHINPSWLRGGFLGVDIFFVISGYLISGNIFRDLDRGSFSFKRFYEKRIRRIFPAFLLVLSTTLAVGWFVLFSEEFKTLGNAIMGSTAFSSNIQLYLESGYFDKASELKPLLHIWSLSLEEQFYFCLPLLFVRLPSFRRDLEKQMALLALLFTASFYLTLRNPSLAFYAPTRFWELLVGTILAANELYCRPLPARRSSLLSCVAFIVLVLCLVLIDGGVNFPGWKAALPVCATGILIANRARTGAGKILTIPLLIAIGLISYPLYLWHWPALYFTKVMMAGTDSSLTRLLAIAAAFALATATYQFFEKKLRFRAGRAIVGVLLIWNVLLIGLGSAAKDHGNLNKEKGLLKLGVELPQKTRQSCPVSDELRKTATWCFEDKRGTANAVVLGDSHSHAVYPGFLNGNDEKRWSLVALAGCPPLYRVKHLDGDGWREPHSTECQKFMTDAGEQLARNPDIETVLLVATAYAVQPSLRYTSLDKPDLNSDESFELGFKSMIELLLRSGKEVIFLVDHPRSTLTPELCLPRPIGVQITKNPNCVVSRNNRFSSTAKYLGLVNRLRVDLPGLKFFDPTSHFCKNELCPVLKDGRSLFSYGDHLSDHGNRIVGEAFRKWYSQPQNPTGEIR